jgi:hypothetical protein
VCQHDNIIDVSSQVVQVNLIGYAHCKGECYDSPVVDKTKSRRRMAGGSASFEASISLIFKILDMIECELGMFSIASKQNNKRLTCI